MLRQRRLVLRKIAARQDAAVDLRMQGLDAAIQHFRETRVIRHFGDGQAIVGQQLGGAAGGQELDAHGGQFAREFEHAGLVGNGDESLFDHDGIE